jgi:hypothetical protein
VRFFFFFFFFSFSFYFLQSMAWLWVVMCPKIPIVILLQTRHVMLVASA